MAENKHDKKQNRIIAGSLKNVGAVFDDTAWKAIHIATNSGYDPQNGEPFSFSRIDTRKKAEKMLKQFVSRLQGVVLTGNNVSWSNANDKNDALITTLANGKKIPKELLMQWQHHNLHALTEFNTRTENGMNLSDRIWDVGKQYRSELELALSLGIGEGKSADVLSRDVRQYLQHPNMLFRRVRDADHNLQLSKPAQAYHPGRGVYRSSYKNALRLTATENNMAYRTADHTKWQQMNFVLGIQIKTSPNNHPKTDICDTLQGRYPKEFKFRGWHPWCRCIAIPILPNEKAFFNGLEKDLKGEYCPYGNQVLTMPRRFNEWVSTNTQRMSEAKTTPYWIKDNFAKGNMEKGLQFVTVSEEQYSSLKQIAKDVGVKIGVPMSHEMADTSHPNPHFAEDMGCHINCQSVVMAYTLRRMGLPVEAYSNNGSTCMGAYVMKNTRAAWASEDGTLPEQIVSKRAVKDRTIDKRGYVKRIYTTPSEVLADFETKTITPGQYHVKWKWQGTNVGHIINMEVFPDGSRKYSCSQGDRTIEGKNLLPWLKGKKGNIRIDLDNGLMAYRVDNLKPNATIVRGLVKKSGSKTITPNIDDLQLKIWDRLFSRGKLSNLSYGMHGKTLADKYFDAKSNSECIQVLKEEIKHGYRKVQNEKNIFCNYDLLTSNKDEASKNLIMARKLRRYGFSVYITSGSTYGRSGDFILVKNGRYYYVEAKASTGKNSLDHNLHKGASQADRVLLDIATVRNTKYIENTIKNAFDNSTVREIWLFKNKRLIIIRREYIGKDFGKNFKKLWEQKN